MGTYVYITPLEMLDAAQIRHLKYGDGTLDIWFDKDHKVTYKGPQAKMIFDKLHEAFEAENEVCDNNAALIKGSKDAMDRGQDEEDWL